MKESKPPTRPPHSEPGTLPPELEEAVSRAVAEFMPSEWMRKTIEQSFRALAIRVQGIERERAAKVLSTSIDLIVYSGCVDPRDDLDGPCGDCAACRASAAAEEYEAAIRRDKEAERG